MADLYGSLGSFGIAPLARFLCGVRKCGDLLVTTGSWSGRLSFSSGLLVGASCEGERGRAALELIANAMLAGEFEFVERPPAGEPDPDLASSGLELFEQLAAPSARIWRTAMPPLTAVPYLVADQDGDSAEVSLDRTTIGLLMYIDGRRDVRGLGQQFGVLRTVRGLGRLYELGLVEFSAPPPASSSATAVDGAASLQHRLRRFPGQVARGRAGRVGWELLQAVAVTSFVVLSVRSLVLNFRVEGISMQPTFESGQILLVNRAAYFHVDWKPVAELLPTRLQGSIAYLFGGPQRGDVVVFNAPIQPGTDYIKRIIGLPGDRVAINNGNVFVNGAALNEPYIRVPANYQFPDGGGVAIVPSDSYFVLGDNRPESLDSHFGWFVPVDDLVGRAWLRYWPPDELGVVQSPRVVEAPVNPPTAASK
jgi:signal peptidase I